MSDGEVLVSGGEASESGDEIFKRLPPWMPRDESSGNFKLLDVVGRGFDRLGDDISDADDASNVQTAQSVEQVETHAKLVGVVPKSEESVEKYRRRVVGEFQNTTNEGDLPGILKNISILLDVNIGEVGYIESAENGSVLLTVPGNSIDSGPLTQEEFGEIISDQVAAGFRAEIQIRGTFTYVTSTVYNNENHDAAAGYDGLDSNSDQKDNGGTYAGIIE